MTDSLDPDDGIEVNGHTYPCSVYQPTTRATGTQQWVADQWASGALPTHSATGASCKLYTSNNNFRGLQYPDGRGVLKHYSTIEAVRTLSGLVITNTECFSRGFAFCTTPRDSVCPNGKEPLPLTQYTSLMRASSADLPHWRHIEQVDVFDGTYKNHDRLIVAMVDDVAHCIPASTSDIATVVLDDAEAREFARLTDTTDTDP